MPAPRAALVFVVIAACSGGPASPIDPPIIPTGPFVPGQSYFSRDGYIEYVAGNAPVILTAPHGGSVAPAAIATRSCGTNTTDLNTQDLVRQMQRAIFAQSGRYPHVVINLLARNKLDANRDVAEASCGDTLSTAAWNAWHAFLGIARGAVIASDGKGWYMDMHGHGHEVQRLELGYLLTDADLGRTNATLDGAVTFENASSITTISRDAATLSFSALLRGPTSLGALYAEEGFPAVPSANDPSPNGAEYFNGGYNTERYGCRGGGMLCGVQIEANLTGVRDNAANRTRFAEATARILDRYLSTHWGIRLRR
jgi:hypothetical protein